MKSCMICHAFIHLKIHALVELSMRKGNMHNWLSGCCWMNWQQGCQPFDVEGSKLRWQWLRNTQRGHHMIPRKLRHETKSIRMWSFRYDISVIVKLSSLPTTNSKGVTRYLLLSFIRVGFVSTCLMSLAPWQSTPRKRLCVGPHLDRDTCPQLMHVSAFTLCM